MAFLVWCVPLQLAMASYPFFFCRTSCLLVLIVYQSEITHGIQNCSRWDHVKIEFKLDLFQFNNLFRANCSILTVSFFRFTHNTVQFSALMGLQTIRPYQKCYCLIWLAIDSCRWKKFCKVDNCCSLCFNVTDQFNRTKFIRHCWHCKCFPLLSQNTRTPSANSNITSFTRNITYGIHSMDQ